MFVMQVLTLILAMVSVLVSLNAARLAVQAAEDVGYRYSRYRRAAKSLAAQRDRRQRQRTRHV